MIEEFLNQEFIGCVEIAEKRETFTYQKATRGRRRKRHDDQAGGSCFRREANREESDGSDRITG